MAFEMSPHFRGPGIESKDRSGQKEGEDKAEHTGNDSDPEKSAAACVDGGSRALS